MMTPTYASICFFMPTGKTFTFRNVTIVSDNESVIEFTYTAMSDDQLKHGVFIKANIAGVGYLADKA